MPAASTRVRCGAARSIAPHRAGKNQTSVIRSAINPEALIVNVTSSDVAAKAAGQGLGVGTRCRAAEIMGAPRGSGGGAPAVTGKVSVIEASSGMHVFSDTSQLA